MRNYLLNKIKDTIDSWDIEDIYVISLFVYDNEDNPLKPSVTLGYNTESNFRDSIKLAWDEEEARWNYAFYLQNEEMKFGDEQDKEIIANWLKEKGNVNEEQVTSLFVNELISIVKELHDSGFILSKFKKELPILIHELEYYDEIAKQNIDANGLELVKDFVKFCRGF